MLQKVPKFHSRCEIIVQLEVTAFIFLILHMELLCNLLAQETFQEYDDTEFFITCDKLEKKTRFQVVIC